MYWCSHIVHKLLLLSIKCLSVFMGGRGLQNTEAKPARSITHSDKKKVERIRRIPSHGVAASGAFGING